MRRDLLGVLATLELGGGAAGAIQPNDPVWREQVAAQKIGLPQLWETTTGDPGTIIAIVDTGVNLIPDLEGALVPGYDFIDNDLEAQDVDSHGTRVASVIAARGNNGVGMAGHCWKCRIMPVRISENGTTTPAGIATGIVYAVDHGAKIINVSFAHRNYDSGEADAVRYAAERGAIVVASAGNTGNDVPQYPAAYPGVLSVGATDMEDALYFWSSRGPWVLLTAPGCHMVVDLWYPPGTLCGTSFTPSAVAGVLGLLWSRNPSLSREQVLSAVLGTARPIPGIVYGRIDPVAAFRRLGLPIVDTPAAAPPTPTPRPAPGQRFTRQTIFETGTFKRGFRSSFRVGRGRFEMQLLTPLASACSLSLSKAGELTVAAPAVKNLISLSIPVTAGRYTAEVQCRGARTRQYSLGVIAMFPRGFP